MKTEATDNATQQEIPMLSTLAPFQKLQSLTAPKPEPVNNRRNGKIARLPKETRDLINRMLEDGLPYKVIIDELGQAGAGLNPQNLTNWAQGGYQEYLRQQDLLYRAKTQMEFALDILKETGDTDPTLIHKAISQVVGCQILDAVMDHGDESLRKLLKERPERYLTLVNTIIDIADSTIRLEQHDWQRPPAASASPAHQAQSSPIKPQEKFSAQVPPASCSLPTPISEAPASPAVAHQAQSSSIKPHERFSAQVPPPSCSRPTPISEAPASITVGGHQAQSSSIKPKEKLTLTAHPHLPA